MKSGEFAKLCNSSKDTIRYYTGIGLLMPKSQGSQKNYTERDVEDLRYIQKLKKMQFNIKEIKAFLQMRRMSNFVEPSTLSTYKGLLEEKRKKLVLERDELEESISLIDEETENIEKITTTMKKGKSGVPLAAIPILACPHCRKQLNIENADIRYKYIDNGLLTCTCGYQAQICDGVILTGNLYHGEHDKPDLKRELYHDTGEEWAVIMQKCTDLLLDEVNRHSLSGKVVMEPNINGFFFSYHFLAQMPKDCMYIFVDKYEEVLRMYKDYFEILYQDLDILYIADASEHYPLKDESVDLKFGLFSENEYTLYHKRHQIMDISNLLKPEAEILEVYCSYGENSVSRKRLMDLYPEGSRRTASISFLEEDYRKNGFTLQKTEVGHLSETKKHHSYIAHIDGEQITIYFCAARRQT
ncbi:MerR family transcriptional regulator [Clostridium transplantifaecale]|uniref:MerR family transcriptional regulator n=1 Tax=Clostridium transplantifaecale TaxID=2479838 RepID=UPI000F641F29|nr:MerR family transcriptional regulator [Clostridium transplantifaecale]